MSNNVERWVEKFKNFGAQPSPSRYVALFDPEGTVFDSSMERPLKVAEMAPHMEGILKLMPDLHITVSRWRAQADTVFVEAQNTATIAGQKTIWDAVYCVTLRGPISTRSTQAGRRSTAVHSIEVAVTPVLRGRDGQPRSCAVGWEVGKK